jgi:hypothetical protein
MSTIPLLFMQRVQQNPEATFGHFLMQSGEWECITYENAFEEIAGFAQRLYAFGVDENSNVAIWSGCRLECFFIEMAIWSLGGCVTSIFSNNSTRIMEELQRNRVEMLIVEYSHQYLDMEDELDNLDDLVHFLSIENSDDILPLTTAKYDLEWFVQMVEANPYNGRAMHLQKGGVYFHQDCLEVLTKYQQYLKPTDSILIGGDFHSENRLFVYASLLSDARCYFSTGVFSSVLENLQPSIVFVSIGDCDSLKQCFAQRSGSFGRFLLQWSDLVGNMTEQGSVKKRIRMQRSIIKRLLTVLFYRKMEMKVHSLCVDQRNHSVSTFWKELDIDIVPDATMVYSAND